VLKLLKTVRTASQVTVCAVMITHVSAMNASKDSLLPLKKNVPALQTAGF